MGLPVLILYGEEDVAAILAVIKNLVSKIESGKFTKEDLVDLKDVTVELGKIIEEKDE